MKFNGVFSNKIILFQKGFGCNIKSLVDNIKEILHFSRRHIPPHLLENPIFLQDKITKDVNCCFFLPIIKVWTKFDTNTNPYFLTGASFNFVLKVLFVAYLLFLQTSLIISWEVHTSLEIP